MRFPSRVKKLREQTFYGGYDGYVRLVDVMGTERAIVDAARISYGKGTKIVQKDVDLIRYLMRHKHTSPFEMVELKFHIRVPMDMWRQWIRHRTANVNEYSTRYSEAIDAMAITAPTDWRRQSKDNKQGSSGVMLDVETGIKLCDAEQDFHRAARELYQERLALGVAREQARKDLPLSTYTEAIWKIDLHNLLHFLALRMHPHAQREIREFAHNLYMIVLELYPNVIKAFDDYIREAKTFASFELYALQHIVEMLERYLPGEARAIIIADLKDNKASNREIREMLKTFGLEKK